MEPNEPLNAAPQPDAAPVTTQSPAATQERPAEKPRAAVRVTQQFVVRMQRGQNEAALPPKGGKPPLRATYNAVGQLLYRVGTQAEYTCIRLGRGIRGAFRLALRAAAALLRFVGGRCWRCFPASGTTLRPRRVVLPAACAICATPRGRKPRRAAAASGPVLPILKTASTPTGI